MRLTSIIVRPVQKSEEPKFKELMGRHHYLGFLPKIGNTIWYFVLYEDKILALLSFSSSALRIGARDTWIGWDYRHRFDRLHLIANNSRFLILPQHHYKNLASRVLSLCQRRIQNDWIEKFGFPLLLLETFVDPTKYHGTVYKAANWQMIGTTHGYKRIRGGYSDRCVNGPKQVYIFSLQRNTRMLLSQPILNQPYNRGVCRMKLDAEKMKALPEFFENITDPRRKQGQRHRLKTILALAAGAILCGAIGYTAIHEWATQLGQKSRERFCCRYENGKYIVPCKNSIRDLLMRISPTELDRVLGLWNEQFSVIDASLAIDGKTMKNAIDEEGRQIHIMSAIGHSSKQIYTQKKSENYL